jgi:hypothetical protein
MRWNRAVLAAAALWATFAHPAVAQEMPPNAPHYVKSLQAPNLEVRFLDFKWDQEAFDTLRSGGKHPIGSRSWVLARLVLTKNPMRCEGKIIPVGPAILILNPAKAGAAPTVELRAIDMREVFVDMNVVAEPPPGETYYLGPAKLKAVEKKAERLNVRVSETKDGLEVITHYGDREMTVTLTR